MPHTDTLIKLLSSIFIALFVKAATAPCGKNGDLNQQLPFICRQQRQGVTVYMSVQAKPSDTTGQTAGVWRLRVWAGKRRFVA